ncbi:SWIB/MDM2 domain protein [Medicago truncatula]|uniref:SWIB/MDM2 domain protein n=1 Tax=Medicago truncatula TaxID=3880 RepID=A0A072UXW7_MEDTR|nr:SWIB/MDM2 domain protein [Medicago truncatula]
MEFGPTLLTVLNIKDYFDTKKQINYMFETLNLKQDPNNKNVVNCDEKLKGILLGKPQVDLAELPALIKLHFPKEPK